MARFGFYLDYKVFTTTGKVSERLQSGYFLSQFLQEAALTIHDFLTTETIANA